MGIYNTRNITLLIFRKGVIMNKILVPIDGSLTSQKAAEKAVAIAKLLNCEITFITVVNLPSEDKYTYFGLDVQTAFRANRKVMLEEMIKQETKMLNVIVRNLNLGDLKINKNVIVGVPSEQILKVSEDGYDLIIMGRKGFSNIERFFIGSVTQRVLTGARCPVLVTNDEGEVNNMKKILVPIDGSSASVKAAEKAVEIAKELNSSITFMTVLYELDTTRYFRYGIAIDLDLDKTKENLKEKENKMLNAVIAKLDLADLNYDKIICSGEAYEEILIEANKGSYDLIVMGRRGFSKIQRFFVGSVTQRVISESPCPVLVVQE